MLATANTVGGLTIAFYILSMTVIIGGFVVSGLRAAIAFGRAREAWENNLEATKVLSGKVDKFTDRVEEIDVRVTRLEKVRR